MDLLEQQRVKAWLLSGARTESEIVSLERSAANIRTRAVSVASLCRDGQATAAAERYAATVRDYTRRLSEQAAAVRAVIESVPDETERAVLELRYVRGLTIEVVADIMNYSTASVIRHHRAALSSVRDILNASAADE